MTEARSPSRWTRFFVVLVLLGAVAGGGYFASWLNAKRFFLIVDRTEVRVAKGRMLPVGEEPFIPRDPGLRRAYERFPLPGGMGVPRGKTQFSDRVELDQALYRLLKDATEFTIASGTARAPELTARYLKQIKALPGVSVEQQVELMRLGRDAQYVEAVGHLRQGLKRLKTAQKLFEGSSQGGGGRHNDGDTRARAVARALDILSAVGSIPPQAVKSGALEPPTRGETAATSTTPQRSMRST